jgi:hypothetical protein
VGRLDNPTRPRRYGCGGCLAQSALALAGGCALIYLLYALLAPWNFYFGGHFHVVPGWAGQGWMRSAAGGNYYLWLQFTPTTPGYRKSPLKGTGVLCTPRGEKFHLHFGGSILAKHGSDLRGVPIHLYLYNWPLLGNFVGDRRPSFDLYGTFGNSELILEDHGSLARAFRSDGTLHVPRDQVPWKQETTPVTLVEDSWAFNQSCPSPK